MCVRVCAGPAGPGRGQLPEASLPDPSSSKGNGASGEDTLRFGNGSNEKLVLKNFTKERIQDQVRGCVCVFGVGFSGRGLLSRLLS